MSGEDYEKKTSNKIKDGVDKLKNKITNEEYDEESNRYRDKDTKQYTRAPNDE